LDRVIVERKLDSLQRCLARIADKRPASLGELTSDIDLQDVLVLNISRAVQISVDLAAHLITDLPLPPPDTMGEAFDRLADAGMLDAALSLRMKNRWAFAMSPSTPMTVSTGTSSLPSPATTFRTSRTSPGWWRGMRPWIEGLHAAPESPCVSFN